MGRFLSTFIMEALRSPETSVHTRATRRHMSESGILFSHTREILKNYKKEADKDMKLL
jgi:hypothetical protein